MHTLSPVRGFSAQLLFTHPHSVTRFGFGVPTGHVATTPLHLDAEAQLFSLSQILFADADTTWHCDPDPSSAVQHGKRRAFWGEHVYPAFVLTVQLDVQHDLFVHANPQSQSSPYSTIPLPQCGVDLVKQPLFLFMTVRMSEREQLENRRLLRRLPLVAAGYIR
jgi:hypothetical protein